jgi:hypothetical protein
MLVYLPRTPPPLPRAQCTFRVGEHGRTVSRVAPTLLPRHRPERALSCAPNSRLDGQTNDGLGLDHPSEMSQLAGRNRCHAVRAYRDAWHFLSPPLPLGTSTTLDKNLNRGDTRLAPLVLALSPPCTPTIFPQLQPPVCLTPSNRTFVGVASPRLICCLWYSTLCCPVSSTASSIRRLSHDQCSWIQSAIQACTE